MTDDELAQRRDQIRQELDRVRMERLKLKDMEARFSTEIAALEQLMGAKDAGPLGKTVAGGGERTLYEGAWGITRRGEKLGPFKRVLGVSYPWTIPGTGLLVSDGGHWIGSDENSNHDIVEIVAPAAEGGEA